ncbi:unnamed protein product [Rotaria magnacalcarata]|uniref:ATP-dependent DNA helicase n=1 Tax=Rotaria magnacalcarata TaxID=392030 RepID=A0A814TRX1_9BILA|nr:unnamed protein product [Rotaria magnacalcarata]
MILEPFSDDEKLTKKEREEINKKKENVMKELEKISKDIDNSLPFDEFLEYINMNEKEYIKMIRVNIKKAKVFLKRAPNDIRINAYNPKIMSLHKGNMDIQFILDPYACLKYCVECINKSENGMSKLLREALNELKKGNNAVRERLRVIANKFLNSSEISAQEAVYHILSISLSISSRSTVFINTNRPENRISMLKSDEILQKLEPDSKNVFYEGLIEMYVNRPDEMKNVCLADFASMYNVSKKKTDNDRIIENSDDEDITENESDNKTAPMKMKDGKGWIKKRTKEKIIRYRYFKLHQDPENYYREQLMLFLPWTNEGEDLIHINHEERFELCKDIIQQKRSEYIHREANEFEQALAEHMEKKEDEDDIDDTNIEYDQDKNEFLIYEIGNTEGDIFVEMGINTRTGKVEHCNVPKIIPDTEYQQIMRTKKLFGGISVIVLGDFNQLRPVGDKYIFQFNNSYNALVDSPLWSLFELFELTEIMRQKDDKTFAIALSNIAKGTMTGEDIHLLKSRIASTENLETIEDAIRIFRSNVEVDAYNTKVLANLNTEGATANAYDFCIGDGLVSLKEKVLNNVKNLKTTETYGLPLKIDLEVGAKYTLTVNSDTEDGLVNGACGKLVMIDYGKLQKTNETVPCRIWIKFNEEKTGRKARANFHNVMRNRNINSSLTPIEPHRLLVVAQQKQVVYI